MLVVFEKVCRSDLIIFSADKNDACPLFVLHMSEVVPWFQCCLPADHPLLFIKAVLKELLHFFYCGHLLH